MADSPTKRTLDYLRREGWTVDVVERYNPYGGQHNDFCGFADLIAYKGPDTLAIQATSTTNISHRVKKLLAMPEARDWVDADFRHLCVAGWRKYKQRVDGKLWRPTWRPIELSEFTCEAR